MKVLMLNGSPNKNGVCAFALNEMKKVFEEEGIEVVLMNVGSMKISGCIDCGYCRSHNGCVFDDEVKVAAKEFEEADGLVLASPVYYASANGTLISFLDRLFHGYHFDRSFKVGASIVSARRGGTTATFDELNKYFTICGMPVASSCYWNNIHGNTAEEAMQDEEGLVVMRTLARNMTFLMNAIKHEKERNGLPKQEKRIATNFIRK